MQAIITVDFYIPNSHLTGEHCDASQLNLRRPLIETSSIYFPPRHPPSEALNDSALPQCPHLLHGVRTPVGSAWK